LQKVKKNEEKFGKLKKSPYLCIVLGEILTHSNKFFKQTKFSKMKTSSLTSKLNKLNVAHTVKHTNEHNKALDFTINGKKFSADFTATSEEIHFFTTIIGYDHAEQEHQRLFFYTFSAVLRYAN